MANAGNRTLCFMTCAVSLGGLLLGFDTGVISGLGMKIYE